MTQEITLNHFVQWLQRNGEYIDAKETYLSELDAAIGDADHGANMARGMEKVCTRLAEEGASYPNVSTLMRNVAMTLISSVGGAAGPLYGAFFLRVALDEKTMIDTLAPAVEALVKAVAAGADVDTALQAACMAAKSGMQHTIMLQASKGRASYLGPRSIGHQDPGATSAYYLFLAAQETWRQDDQ